VKRHKALLVVSFAGFLCCTAQAEGPPLVITDVTFIDTRGGPPRAGMAVIIRGDGIAEVREAARDAWPGATVLDGRGKFLIPGLWDMEVHLSWTTASAELSR
jgi:imidazolonepropionase-like amidohydrolase